MALRDELAAGRDAMSAAVENADATPASPSTRARLTRLALLVALLLAACAPRYRALPIVAELTGGVVVENDDAQPMTIFVTIPAGGALYVRVEERGL